MKLKLVSAISVLALTAQGALYTFSGSPAQDIRDNDPSGAAYAFSFSNTGLQITSVSVTLTISGGYNGDLYAHLSHGSSTLVLLNRVGVANGTVGSTLYDSGYSGSGFNNITLSDSGSGNIHNYGGSTLESVPTASGTYRADGQTANPLNAPTGFNAAGGSATFASIFGGTDPYGNWTLFLSDLSGGSIATLSSWSVGIEAVPEPANVALAVFGVLFGAVQTARCCRRRRST
jgi:subtilisin-like proprotein convertase family protein